jgi:hypothetical protein
MEVRSSLLVRVATIFVSIAALAVAVAPATAQVFLERQSRVGVEPNGPSNGGVADADGSCVAFYSDATNLLPQGVGGDNNGFTDVFVADRDAGVISLVSVGAGGEAANGPSMAQGFRPSIDAGCTCVAFSSDATNLVAGDSNRRTDVFVRLLEAGTTELASVGVDGPANGSSSAASVSGDCGRVAFQSTASNLVAGDENRKSDIFVYDRGGAGVSRVSVGAGGEEANGSSITPSMSADGRCVAFASAATNLWPGDTNGVNDIYVACDGQITCRASVNGDGDEADAISFHPALSADGNIVAFKSEATNLVANDFNRQPDVFVHDCTAGTTVRVSVSSAGVEGNDISIPPTISDDGTQVAFGSFASNLIVGTATGGHSQIYVHDLTTGETILISADEDGNAANGSSPDIQPSISRDGNFVAFTSLATNLVPGDTNGYPDVFIGSVGAPPPPTPTPTPTEPLIPCSLDQDCPAGQICGPDGFCIKAPTPTPTIPCQMDEDCPEGLVCIGNVCTDPSTPTPTPTPLPTCETDEDCLEPGTVCRAGVCVPHRECESGLECRGERETCLDFFCECGGDCNLNGLVFGSEISRMMCQLGGSCSIDECPAGDINQDGQVTGCEVSLAVRNLGLGCPGEGVPLVFGEQRTSETRTINIGSVAGAAGQFIDIPVSLEGGDEVTTAHTDILIPFERADVTVTELESGELRPNCMLDARLQGTFFPEIRLPQQPRNPEGIRRLRLAEVDITPPFPLDFFGEGPLFSCRFRIGAGEEAGAVIPLMGDPTRTEIGDFNAQPFNSVVSDGSITVIDIMCSSDEDCPEGTFCQNGKCVPDIMCETFEDCLPRQACIELPDMSGVNRCECVGDCNLDGRVRSNEITAMINIINGATDVTTCLAADQNGDGRVRANDITLAILNINQGCPGQ